MDAQLKKGVLKLCVLQGIAAEWRYGYSLIEELHALFPEVEESTVYAILRRLHADGDAEVRMGSESGGPARKYYHVTGQGAATLAQLTGEWAELVRRMGCLGLN